MDVLTTLPISNHTLEERWLRYAVSQLIPPETCDLLVVRTTSTQEQKHTRRSQCSLGAELLVVISYCLFPFHRHHGFTNSHRTDDALLLREEPKTVDLVNSGPKCAGVQYYRTRSQQTKTLVGEIGEGAQAARRTLST